jgi:cyanophycin synthetase
VLKEMEHYRRGRQPGEISAILAEELVRCGFPSEAVTRTGSELEGVREALSWARGGDLLVLTVHQDRSVVLGLLDTMRVNGWRAGKPVPG